MKTLKVVGVVVLGVAVAAILIMQYLSLSRMTTTDDLANVATTDDLANVATTDQLANAVDLVTKDVAKVVAADGDKTRNVVANEGVEIRDAIMTDGQTTRDAIEAMAEADKVAIAKIEQRLRAHGKRLATFATRTELASFKPVVDLSGLATRADLTAMEGRLMAESEIVVKPEGDATIRNAAVPEKPAASK